MIFVILSSFLLFECHNQKHSSKSMFRTNLGRLAVYPKNINQNIIKRSFLAASNKVPHKKRFYKFLVGSGFFASSIFFSSTVFADNIELNNSLKYIKKPQVMLQPGPIVMDIPGTDISLNDIKNITHPMVGGVILMKWNIESKEQVCDLVKKIKYLRPDILIFVDQEGGYIQWIQGSGLCKWPSAYTYGKIYDENPKLAINIANKFGKELGKELSDLNIDVALAPVLDLHRSDSIIGKKFRAFHSNPKINTKLAQAFADGLRNANIISVGKHFPGHSISLSDSHDEMPTCEITLKQLEKDHLFPFITLAKNEKIDGLMPAHIKFSKVDPNNTVSLSEKWLREILQKKYKFKGFIISDCLFMEGANIGTMSERIIQAIKAGCDMVIVTHQEANSLYKTLNEVKIYNKENNIIDEAKLDTIYKKLKKITNKEV